MSLQCADPGQSTWRQRPRTLQFSESKHLPQCEMHRHAHMHHADRLTAAGSQHCTGPKLHEKVKTEDMQIKQGMHKRRHAVARDCVNGVLHTR